MNAIEITDIHKAYAAEQALKGISFSVPDGSLFGLIGADGAGKTTLMRILSTLISADSGNAFVVGKSIQTDIRTIRCEIGYMSQRFSLYGDLSVRENLIFFADIFGINPQHRESRIARLLEFSRLGPFQNRRAAHLSGGMKQKLALSCALIHQPRLLLLDEPTTGVDPVSRDEFWSILRELRSQGITIVISTPYMEEAALCEKLVFLHHGLVIQQGAPEDLLRSYPYDLYEVSHNGESVNCPHDLPPPGKVVLMYPVGGMLHAAAVPGKGGTQDVRASISSVVPRANTIRRIDPSIEDLFFLLLSGSKGDL